MNRWEVRKDNNLDAQSGCCNMQPISMSQRAVEPHSPLLQVSDSAPCQAVGPTFREVESTTREQFYYKGKNPLL